MKTKKIKINWKSILVLAVVILVYLLLQKFGVIGSDDGSVTETDSGLILITNTPGPVTQDPNVTQVPTVTDIPDAIEAETGSNESAEIEPETRYYFRNNKYLTEHFEKHGGEFTYSNKEEYEAGASAVINNPNALSKPETDSDNTVFYIEDTNEFVVLSADGYIRTYFKPSAGKAYFDRQ